LVRTVCSIDHTVQPPTSSQDDELDCDWRD